eukprot:scaffold127328_cov16-Tisochrysis_lutea.AAC.2
MSAPLGPSSVSPPSAQSLLLPQRWATQEGADHGEDGMHVPTRHLNISAAGQFLEAALGQLHAEACEQQQLLKRQQLKHTSRHRFVQQQQQQQQFPGWRPLKGLTKQRDQFLGNPAKPPSLLVRHFCAPVFARVFVEGRGGWLMGTHTLLLVQCPIRLKWNDGDQ